MIKRYTLPQMGRIWSDEHRFEVWMKVEMLALEAWCELGLFPREILEKVRNQISFSSSRMEEIEARTRHDVIAFLTTLSESIGPEARFLHFGMTSSDMLDTANAYLMKESCELILKDIDTVLEAIKDKALTYRYTLMIGRTHGVHAEPTTFGLKMALWYAEMQRNRTRVQQAKETISVGKISGAVGNYAHIDPRVEKYVCEKLGLTPAPVSSQIIQRDRYAEVIWSLAMVATSLEKFATELRNLQRTEIREVEEGFGAGQKGSSAMPHKKNPITGEQICGLSRVLRGNLVTSLENIPLWHERDISHSSAERIILPDSFILADYLLNTFARLLNNLVVYPQNMKKNLEKSRGLVFSERILLELVKRGLTREQAYEVVQKAAMRTWENENLSFQEALQEEPVIQKHFSQEDLKKMFSYDHFIKHVDYIFKRVGLEE
ncbi:adenylosuccinate lyase [Thermatribacter velox]|uniref:Adenylosuccinate lyase n=1 Tax=Thermatribacter velox TaxID=3039681 RepID=A0ABZ2YDS6_9BACT